MGLAPEYHLRMKYAGDEWIGIVTEVFCYVILTHGSRQFDRVTEHPAARQQVRNLRYIESEQELTLRGPAHDYARRIRSITDLPMLCHAMKIAEEKGSYVVMDDIGRIFRIAKEEDRKRLLSGLLYLGDNLFGYRQGTARLHEDPQLIQSLLRGGDPGLYSLTKTTRKTRSPAMRRIKNRKAAKASAIARGQAADAKAEKLIRVRDELIQRGEPATLTAIAREANQTGLTTTRGRPHTATSVKRALERLAAQPTSEEHEE